MAKKTYVNVGGVNKEVKNVWQNVVGVWKSAVVPKVNVGGSWKECMEYYDPIILVTTSDSSNNRITAYDSNLNQLWSRHCPQDTGLNLTVKIKLNRHPDPDYFISYEPWGSDRGGRVAKRRKSDGYPVATYDFNGYCSDYNIAVNYLGEIAFVGYTPSNRQYVTILNNDLTRKTYFNPFSDNTYSTVCNPEDNSNYMYVMGSSNVAICNFDGSVYETSRHNASYHKGFISGFKQIHSILDTFSKGYSSGSTIYHENFRTAIGDNQILNIQDVIPFRSNRDLCLMYSYNAFDGTGIYKVDIANKSAIKLLAMGSASPYYDVDKNALSMYVAHYTYYIKKFDINGTELKSITPYGGHQPEDLIVL